MHTPTGSRWVSNNYITRCHRRLELVSSVPVAAGYKMPEWEPAADGGLGPSATHSWPAQPEEGRSTAMVARRTLGQYVAVCPCLQLTSRTQPTSTLSKIKRERYIFIKKRVCSFIEVRHYCWLCFRIYLHLVIYNTFTEVVKVMNYTRQWDADLT